MFPPFFGAMAWDIPSFGTGCYGEHLADEHLPLCRCRSQYHPWRCHFQQKFLFPLVFMQVVSALSGMDPTLEAVPDRWGPARGPSSGNHHPAGDGHFAGPLLILISFLAH